MKKCPYCDFYSITDLSVANDFLHAVLTEIHLRKTTAQFFDTIYIGGGTPSVLKPEQIRTLLEAVFHAFNILPDPEITIEINPGTINLSALKKYRGLGINRLSIGIQSFSENNLNFLGRIHSAKDAIDTITSARKANFSNISIDLIYGLPGQTEKSWKTDLKQALDFNPEHLSCYMLTYERDTPLTFNLQKKQFIPLSEKKAGDLFMKTHRFLEQHGYLHYEISNFSRSTALCSKHNRKYWLFNPYIGFGPSAHSFSNNIRSWNHRSVKKYIQDLQTNQLPIENLEHLDKEQRMIEFIYLGLRQSDGINMEAFYANFGKHFDRIFTNTIKILKGKKMITTEQGRCFLTSKGMLFIDSISDMFVSQDF